MRVRIPLSQVAESPLLIGLMLIIGIINLVWPRAAWELTRGWEFEDAEPSDEALYVMRAGGGLLVFLAIIMIVANF